MKTAPLKLLIFASTFTALFKSSRGTIGSLVAARISLQLDDNFEQNSKVIFTYRTIFDRSNGMTEINGITFTLLGYPRGTSLNYADMFGVLQVKCGGAIKAIPNNFTVLYVDGDNIEGEMVVECILSQGNNIAFLPSSQCGLMHPTPGDTTIVATPMLMSGNPLQMGGEDIAVGGLPDCNGASPFQVPSIRICRPPESIISRPPPVCTSD
jgi:hypothetical protein